MHAGRVTASYYDNTSAGTTLSASAGGGTGYATTALQTPTEYGSATTTPPSIYANWNVNVDGVTGNDDPWHFGTASQYPVLKYGGFSPTPQGSTGEDYDDDNDGLIDIRTLAQLDAIRYDMDGNGRPTDVLAYLSAFPLGDAGSDAEMGSARRMGCPAACAGYELRQNLNFDTDGDGSAHTNGVGDPDDGYYTHPSAGGDPGEGWVPSAGTRLRTRNSDPFWRATTTPSPTCTSTCAPLRLVVADMLACSPTSALAPARADFATWAW